jgi:hypothetical protein
VNKPCRVRTSGPREKVFDFAPSLSRVVRYLETSLWGNNEAKSLYEDPSVVSARYTALKI